MAALRLAMPPTVGVVQVLWTWRGVLSALPKSSGTPLWRSMRTVNRKTQEREALVTIELNCPVCQKLIKAPDDAGGKQGKCPYCKNLVYIPSTEPEDEEGFGLAPLDEGDAEREERLKAEAAAYTAELSRDAPKDSEGPGAGGAGGGAGPAPPPGEVADLAGMVERYVVAMRDSKLETVEELIRQLRRVRHRTRDYVQGRIVDEMASPIGDVPEPLVKGFLKALLERMK